MKRITISLLTVFILLLTTVQAGTQQDLYDKTLILHHPSVNISINNASLDQRNGIVQGGNFVTPNSKVGSASSNFLSTSIPSTDALVFNNDDNFYTTINRSIVLWANYTQGTTSRFQTAVGGEVEAEGYLRVVFDDRGGVNLLKCDYFDTVVSMRVETALAPFQGDWNFITCQTNHSDGTTHMQLYINTTLIGENSVASANEPINSGITIGSSDNTLANYYLGGLDEVIVFNKTLNFSEIEFLYNSGDGILLGPEVDALPTTSITSPADNAVLNTNSQSILHTSADTEGITSITLYVDGVANQTDNGNGGSFILNASDGTYELNVTIVDTASQEAHDVISIRLDTVNPISNLSVEMPNGTNLIENRGLNVKADNINISTHNVTVTRDSGEQVLSQLDIVDGPTNTISLTLDLSVLGADGYIVTSNQTDQAGLSTKDTATFNIILPTMNDVDCEFLASFGTCTLVAFGDTVTQTRADCTNGLSATLSLQNQTGTDVFTNQAGTKVGDLYTYDNPDVAIESVGLWNVTGNCTNDAGSTSLVRTITATCTPDYFCSSFKGCNTSTLINECLTVGDNNNCNIPHPGNPTDLNTTPCSLYSATYTAGDIDDIVVDGVGQYLVVFVLLAPLIFGIVILIWAIRSRGGRTPSDTFRLRDPEMITTRALSKRK